MKADEIIFEIRAFNRFYVDLLGLLKAGGYHSSYTLAETRVLFEINEAQNLQASQIIRTIQIDKSYLSRILKRLEKDSLINRKRSDHDARSVILSITERGRSEIEKINLAASTLVRTQIEQLNGDDREKLVQHMKAIVQLLRHHS